MRQLLIFLKYPTPGNVKTRLAAAVGPKAAADVSRACTELTLQRLEVLHREARLYVDPPNSLEQTRAWLGNGWALRSQEGATLGERLSHATSEAFGNGAKRVAVIGTDSPWLTPDDIEDAFEALARVDVVLGPTQDGGYYLVGLARPAPALFEGVAWSTPRVCAQTLAKARALGLAVHLLRTGYDVDRFEDLERLRKEGFLCLS